jgi:D-aminopeptidase
VLAEQLLEPLFEAAAEATEQAILDALFTATAVRGFQGHVRHALLDVASDWRDLPC